MSYLRNRRKKMLSKSRTPQAPVYPVRRYRTLGAVTSRPIFPPIPPRPRKAKTE